MTRYTSHAGIQTQYFPKSSKIKAKRMDHKPGDPIATVNDSDYNDRMQGHGAAAELLIVKSGLDWTVNPIGTYDASGKDRYIWICSQGKTSGVQSITVIGKQWFDRVNGNTYCSADVIVDGKLYQSAYEYGYGDFYLQSAMAILQKAGVIVATEYCPLWQYCSDNGIVLHEYLFDCKKSELNDLECYPL